MTVTHLSVNSPIWRRKTLDMHKIFRYNLVQLNFAHDPFRGRTRHRQSSSVIVELQKYNRQQTHHSHFPLFRHCSIELNSTGCPSENCHSLKPYRFTNLNRLS